LRPRRRNSTIADRFFHDPSHPPIPIFPVTSVTHPLALGGGGQHFRAPPPLVAAAAPPPVAAAAAAPAWLNPAVVPAWMNPAVLMPWMNPAFPAFNALLGPPAPAPPPPVHYQPPAPRAPRVPRGGHKGGSQTYQYVAPASLTSSSSSSSSSSSPPYVSIQGDPEEECPVCLNGLESNAVSLKVCHHNFHRRCVVKALENSSLCPICRVPTSGGQEIRGRMPSGTMTISRGGGWYSFTFTFPSGVQAQFHPNPGTHFTGATRQAFLPENDPQTQNTLKRLIFSFERDLLFEIGTSLTTGQSNTLTYSSIHLKSSKVVVLRCMVFRILITLGTSFGDEWKGNSG
jgi:deltex-like protein